MHHHMCARTRLSLAFILMYLPGGRRPTYVLKWFATRVCGCLRGAAGPGSRFLACLAVHVRVWLLRDA